MNFLTNHSNTWTKINKFLQPTVENTQHVQYFTCANPFTTRLKQTMIQLELRASTGISIVANEAIVTPPNSGYRVPNLCEKYPAGIWTRSPQKNELSITTCREKDHGSTWEVFWPEPFECHRPMVLAHYLILIL